MPMSARFRSDSLDAWYEHQQRLHDVVIDLGLARVAAVWRRLGAPVPAPLVISVGGTNGKGSTIAFLEAMLAAQGLRVGTYTSPHLLRYNERVRVAGAEAGDEALLVAFAEVEAARWGTGADAVPLTFFEFGTLAALWLLAGSRLQVALLEVGLGGRLDAVNIVDADAAIVTTVDLDHQQWLGSDRESIGREKAGIFRRGRPAIVGEESPAASVLEVARSVGADLHLAGRDFRAVALDEASWRWSRGAEELVLPMPRLAAPCQYANAAAALAAIAALRPRLPWRPAALAEGIASARLGARMQRFPGVPELLVDVAHNPQAAAVLAEGLRRQPVPGRTLAVFGAYADKDVEGVVAALAGQVDGWFLAGLEGLSPRGLDASRLQARVAAVLEPGAVRGSRDSIESALADALAAAGPGDRVLAFGSFLVAAAALRLADAAGLSGA